MKTFEISRARAQARAAQGAGEHVSERTPVRERARGGGNAAMRRISVRDR